MPTVLPVTELQRNMAALVDEAMQTKEPVYLTRCGFIVSNFVRYVAESHNDNSIEDPKSFLRANVEGTFLLREAVRRYGRLGERIVRSPLNCRPS